MVCIRPQVAGRIHTVHRQTLHSVWTGEEIPVGVDEAMEGTFVRSKTTIPRTHSQQPASVGRKGGRLGTEKDGGEKLGHRTKDPGCF